MPGLTQKLGKGSLKLLQAILSPFRKGVGIGQEAAFTLAGASEEEKERARKIQQQGLLKQLSLSPTEQTRLEEAPGREVAKTVAGQTAFFVPGASTVAGAVGTGAVAGGLGGFGASAPGEELETALGGAVLGGAIGGGGKIVGKGMQKIGQHFQAKGQKTASNILNVQTKATPKYSVNKEAMEEFAGELGLSGTADDMLGQLGGSWDEVSSAIRSKLGLADDIADDTLIDSFINRISKDTEFIPDDKVFQKEVTNMLNRLDKAGTNATKVYDLKAEIAGEMDSIFKKIDMGRDPNRIEQIKLAFFNSLKDSIDTVSPEVRQLNTLQHKMYELSKGLVKSSKKAKPLKFKLPIGGDIPIGQQQKLQAAAGKGATGLGKILETGGEKVAGISQNRALLQGIIGGETPEEPEVAKETPDDVLLSILDGKEDKIFETSIENQANKGFRITPEIVAMAQIMLSPKEAKKISNAFTAMETKTPDELTEGETKRLNLAKSGLRQIERVKDILGTDAGEVDQGILVKMSIPGKLGARDYDNATFAVADAILRNRTGAAFSEKEIARYRDSLFPRIGDTQSDIVAKIDEIDAILNDMANVSQTAEPDVMSLLRQQGINL